MDDFENYESPKPEETPSEPYEPKHEKEPEPPRPAAPASTPPPPPQYVGRPPFYGGGSYGAPYGGNYGAPPPPPQYGRPGGYGYGVPPQRGYGAPPPPPQPPVRRYDDFMYEPIGFEELEKNNSGDADQSAAQKRGGEKAAIVLFLILVIGSLALGIFGVAHDIVNSKDAIDKLVEAKPIVFYRESKPKGANDPENFKDENGKYTTEGVAALVKPSIVEIYTYENEFEAQNGSHIGTGSGIVLSDEGYIVTNAHVLKADGAHKIKTVDGDMYSAKIIGRDAKTDIAVIKVDGAKLTPATLGNSDETIVGEQVIAIGNPANLSSTVTDGIVSAVNRKIRSDSTGFEMDCIQTNADISPGNSGGALVNMYGQVIGITSSKYVSSSFEGLGFAITVNEAVPIIEQLVKDGYVAGRFRVGVMLIEPTTESKIAAIEKDLGYKLPEDFKGVYISEIGDDSDLKNTELKPKDFITEINGKSVSTYDEFYDAISSQYGAGDTVPATCAHVDKDGKISYYNIKFKLLEDKSGNY